MTEPLRVLWVSNAPWAKTGYGVQTRLGARALQDLGCEVAVFAYYGIEGAITHADGMRIYPSGPLPWGNDMVRGHSAAFEADVVVSLMDVWVQDYWGRKLSQDGRLFCPWLPVDQEPAPAVVIDKLDQAHQPIAMSRFGERMLTEAGIGNVAYVPHSFDGSVYQPGDQAAARAELGLPRDRFVVGMVMANKGNPSRKCWPEQLLAFKEFKRRVPAAWLYLHTLLYPTEDGLDLQYLLQQIGLREGQDYGYTSPYEYVVGWPEARLARLYQAVDILSNASMGEGFGIPILEAQACGTPVVTTSCTSMPELTWAGVCVTDVHPYWTGIKSWAYMPEPGALANAYESLYLQLQDAESTWDLRSAAVQGARPYEQAVVVDTYWRPLVEGWRRTLEATA